MREPGFWIRFVVAALATWRITHLLVLEDGPADIIVRLRLRLGRSFAGTLMDCFKCLSLWIAAPAALFVARRLVEWVFSWLALSATACLLERLGQEAVVLPSDKQPLEGEFDDVLRPETISAPGQPGASNDADGEKQNQQF